MPKSKRSSASSAVMPMLGRNAGREVKQPIGAVPGVTGTKAGKAKKGGKLKSIKTNQGTSGVMRNPS
jgi:hypothetical protein